MATVRNGNSSVTVTDEDLVRTGPGTLAGRYLRMFWQPVQRAKDLPPGRAKPIRIGGSRGDHFDAMSFCASTLSATLCPRRRPASWSSRVCTPAKIRLRPASWAAAR